MDFNVIKDNGAFLRAYRKGGFSACKCVSVYFVKNNLPLLRMGITASKKIGNAVIRNRCKRIIRAAWRESLNQFPEGFDFVILAREGCHLFKSTDVAKHLQGKVKADFERFLRARPKQNK
ncbi:MAG: ribonuclease P protein component [Ruminococcus sp.]|jgi:ribonuclease P protein component|nr:ribonuclease P protein component [Ruminococcus sp.]